MWPYLYRWLIGDLGAEGAFDYLGASACVPEHRPPQAEHCQAYGLYPGRIPAHIQFPCAGVEYAPNPRLS